MAFGTPSYGMDAPVSTFNPAPSGIPTPYDDFTSGGSYYTTGNAGAVNSALTQPDAGGFFSDILGKLGNVNLGTLGSTILSGAGYRNLMNDLSSFGRQAQTGAERIGQQAAEATRFVPFTVTGTTGAGVGTTPEGGTTMTLSPEEQALQNQLFGGASQFYQQAQMPIAQTEQDIYNRMLQVATPERQRQQLALEERLAAQGRLGTSSAAYGGATPEQLALATAQQEQLNQLGLQARQQALAEQQQAAGLGQGMLGAAYMPQSSLLNVLQGGMGVAGLSDVGRRQAAQLQAQSEMAGLDAYLQSQLGRANLGGQGLAALASALGGTQQAATGGLFSGINLGDVWSGIKGIFD
jgi:hypothetical protein